MRYWTQYLGSSSQLSSLALRIENRSYTVIGVMPAGFQFPSRVELWVPTELDPVNRHRTSHNFSALGRMREGVSAAQANADLSAIAQDIIRHSDEQGDYLMADAAAIPLRDLLTGRVGSTLYVLLGAVLFLLLVACANVTNLLLSQAAARGRELAIRHALGAGRGAPDPPVHGRSVRVAGRRLRCGTAGGVGRNQRACCRSRPPIFRDWKRCP